MASKAVGPMPARVTENRGRTPSRNERATPHSLLTSHFEAESPVAGHAAPQRSSQDGRRHVVVVVDFSNLFAS